MFDQTQLACLRLINNLFVGVLTYKKEGTMILYHWNA